MHLLIDQTDKLITKKYPLPPDKLFEPPVLALHESVRSLALHRFGLFPFGIQNGKLELGSDLGLVAGDEEEVERQVVLRFFIQPLWVDPKINLF